MDITDSVRLHLGALWMHLRLAGLLNEMPLLDRRRRGFGTGWDGGNSALGEPSWDALNRGSGLHSRPGPIYGEGALNSDFACDIVEYSTTATTGC